MLNVQGYVAEASGDNVFIFKGNRLITPPTSSGALEGITRNVVMKLAALEGYEVAEATMTRYDLYNADEMFLTGTAAEMISVVEMDRRVIGSGLPGRKTVKLTGQFRRFAAETGVPIE
jgi:branched-chain amino acid aminotransferase